VIAVMLMAFFVVKLWRGAPEVRESASGSPGAAVPQPSSAKAPLKPAGVADIAQQSNPAPAPAPAPESKAADSSGAVVQQVLPVVPRSASNTIQGTIRVKVRVTLDASGEVSSATLIMPGSSQYFARLALQASRKWKFAPAPGNTKDVASTWILEFDFRRSGTQASGVSSK
jgi:TonB family protein